MTTLRPSANSDITVVVPCFNYGRYLGEALASVHSQAGGSPKVIVVDDGSTEPETLAVLAALPDGVGLISQRNTGQSGARNAGIRASDTPLWIVLDADDRLAPGTLEALRAPLTAGPRLGYAYGVAEFFGDWAGELRMPAFDPYKLLFRHTIGVTCLARRELFDDVGGYDPDFSGFEDWDFWLSALEHGWRGRQIPRVTLEYRRHGVTVNVDARREYRAWYRRLRAKHRALYARQAEFAVESDLGLLGRAAYRFYWGPRPIPAALEHRLYSVLFRA